MLAFRHGETILTEPNSAKGMLRFPQIAAVLGSLRSPIAGQPVFLSLFITIFRPVALLKKKHQAKKPQIGF